MTKAHNFSSAAVGTIGAISPGMLFFIRPTLRHFRELCVRAGGDLPLIPRVVLEVPAWVFLLVIVSAGIGLVVAKRTTELSDVVVIGIGATFAIVVTFITLAVTMDLLWVVTEIRWLR